MLKKQNIQHSLITIFNLFVFYWAFWYLFIFFCSAVVLFCVVCSEINFDCLIARSIDSIRCFVLLMLLTDLLINCFEFVMFE